MHMKKEQKNIMEILQIYNWLDYVKNKCKVKYQLLQIYFVWFYKENHHYYYNKNMQIQKSKHFSKNILNL